MRVKDLEARLLARFPKGDAEEWDRVGLSVGDPVAEATGVLCALDPTPDAVRAAADAGVNVLLTHHPVFLEAPSVFTPAEGASSAGTALWAAIRHGVNLIALHTNLDRSEEALRFLADELGLPYLGRATQEGYGALLDGSAITLGELGDLLGDRLGAHPILWNADLDALPLDIHKTTIDGSRNGEFPEEGDCACHVAGVLAKPAGIIAYLSGSAGELALDAAVRGARTIVCGEESYHRLLELINKKTSDNDNISVFVIGHDVSELPYARFLQHVVRGLVGDVPVEVLEEGIHWITL